MIPMLDLKLQYELLRDEIDNAIESVLQNTQFINGPNVIQFEKEAATYLGVKYAISCNSGTDALHLALRACGIGKNDEVITTPFSFAATAEAICCVGATPVFVDIDPISFNISVKDIKKAITKKTRAILPVHIFGQIADIHVICEIAKDENLLVIEDCAQSFGASINNQYTGTFGDAGCFSFFPSKNLGAYGDGGLFITNSDLFAEQFRLLKSHGSNIKNEHQIVGWNSRLDEIQAAILRIKLKYIDKFNQQRIRVAKRYSDSLEPLSTQVPQQKNDTSHVFQQFTILSDKRDSICNQLHEQNIGHAIFYPMPIPKQKAFSAVSRSLDLSNTIDICTKCVSLPIFPEMTDQQVDMVIGAIRQAYVG